MARVKTEEEKKKGREGRMMETCCAVQRLYSLTRDRNMTTRFFSDGNVKKRKIYISRFFDDFQRSRSLSSFT